MVFVEHYHTAHAVFSPAAANDILHWDLRGILDSECKIRYFTYERTTFKGCTPLQSKPSAIADLSLCN